MAVLVAVFYGAQSLETQATSDGPKDYELVWSYWPTTTTTTTSTCPDSNSAVEAYSVKVNGTTTYTGLRGNIRSNDSVTVSFKLKSACRNVRITLVSYKAPGPTFDPNTASQQTIFEQQTGLFNGGVWKSLTVKVPPGCFQIDFVRGAAITQLGPAGSNNFYSAQNRLLDADNGGPPPGCKPDCPPPSP